MTAENAPASRTTTAKPAAMAGFLRLFVVFCLLGAGTLALSYAGLDYWARMAGPSDQERTLVIPKGSGVRTIAQQLENQGIIHHRWPFIALAIIRQETGLLKAGEYAFPANIHPNAILDSMRRGVVVLHKITIPEGLTVQQIFRILSENQILEGDTGTLPAEGTLMPDTYHIVRGESRMAVIARMQSAMQDFLDPLWARKAPNLPFQTPLEAITLASIVERETSIPAERKRVAGVFINRLRTNMPLQADPTVIYALSNGAGALDRPLTRADWKLNNPYNTYVIKGLPPGPIANPGRESIRAVFAPEPHQFYYFVATGDGGHAFSRDYDTHRRAIDAAKARQQAATSGD